MPASRSRTHEWKKLLQQIAERGGALEIAVAHPESEGEEPSAHAAGPDLVWRVKVIDIEEGEIWVEQPVALGQGVRIDRGTELAAAITVGQNRWTFRTVNLGEHEETSTHRSGGLRLRMPTGVARSQRRRLRVDTQGITLPLVEIWPLLDPKSVLPAERASQLAFERWENGESVDPDELFSESVMPSVGPKFTAELANLGGGGVGIVVGADDAGVLGRHRVFWLRLALRPEMPVPVCVSGKVVHTHIDSTQRTYVGVAFDFSFNHPHQQLVASQILGYIELQQELQRQAKAHRDAAAAED